MEKEIKMPKKIITCSECQKNGMGLDAIGHNKRNKNCPFNVELHAVDIAYDLGMY